MCTQHVYASVSGAQYIACHLRHLLSASQCREQFLGLLSRWRTQRDTNAEHISMGIAQGKPVGGQVESHDVEARRGAGRQDQYPIRSSLSYQAATAHLTSCARLHLQQRAWGWSCKQHAQLLTARRPVLPYLPLLPKKPCACLHFKRAQYSDGWKAP